MKVVFMASADFAISALNLIIESPTCDLAAVYTKMPKPANRGYKIKKTIIHTIANKNNILVHTPLSLKSDIEKQNIAEINPDVIIVVAYGLMLPQEILAIPKYGCINIHPSLLPKFRGPSPIQYSLLSGDEKTGVSIIKMNEKLDEGDILLQKNISITQTDNYYSLHDKLSELGAKMLLEALDNIENIKSIKQNYQDISYSRKVTNYKINWHEEAEIICRKIKAFYPNSFFFLDNKRIKILQADHYYHSSIPNLSPGSIINNKIHIQCKFGTVLVPQILQMEGKKPCYTEDFQRGYRLNELTILT